MQLILNSFSEVAAVQSLQHTPLQQLADEIRPSAEAEEAETEQDSEDDEDNSSNKTCLQR
jgi:hypothetical protein